jgi:hypothetical protein
MVMRKMGFVWFCRSGLTLLVLSTGALPATAQRDFADGPLPHPVTFSVPCRSTDLLWPPAALLGILILPVALCSWLRRRALRAAAADGTRAWYGFWRWLNWIVIATWLLWAVAESALKLPQYLDYLLGRKPGSLGFLSFVLPLLPPFLAMMVCSALSRDLYARLTKSTQTGREICRQAVFGFVAGPVPLLMAAFGVIPLFVGQYQQGMLWLVGALLVRVLASCFTATADLAAHALTTGALRDRVFGLARQAGVRLT